MGSQTGATPTARAVSLQQYRYIIVCLVHLHEGSQAWTDPMENTHQERINSLTPRAQRQPPPPRGQPPPQPPPGPSTPRNPPSRSGVGGAGHLIHLGRDVSQPQTSSTSRDVAPRRPRVLPLHEVERGTVPEPAYLLVVEGLVDGDFERLAVGVGDLEREGHSGLEVLEAGD